MSGYYYGGGDEFYVDDDNVPKSRIIYQKTFGKPMMCKPSAHLI